MNRLSRAIVWTGGIALLAATAIDTVAVAGRHVSLPLVGSIELMQAAVLVSGSIAILVATMEGTHARVKLLVDRLGPRGRRLADRFSDLLTLAFFAAILVGTGWLAWDLRHGHEQSELLGVPWSAMRLVALVCLLAACAALVRRIFRPAPDGEGEAE